MHKTNYATLSALLLTTLLVAPLAQADTETKQTEVKEYQFGVEHQALSDSAITRSTENQRISASASKKRSTQNVVLNTDFWIYDAWVERNFDADHDGYHSRFSVVLDADTIYAEVPVYVVMYLGDAQTYYPVHTSSDFFIYGESSNDEFVIETELVSGFRPYDYDILIELYDAQTEELLAVSDHTNDADLSFVPLESENYDRADHDVIIEVREHGGSVYWPLLAGLLSMVIGRKLLRKRHSK